MRQIYEEKVDELTLGDLEAALTGTCSVMNS